MSAEPGWGRPHTCWIELASSVPLGELTVERCTCGKVRQVVVIKPGPA